MKKSLLLFLLSCLFAVGCSDYLIEINQKPHKPEESVFTIDSEGNYIVEAKGGDVVVKVTTNIEYDVVIPEAASWLSLADTRAVREETLTFSVAENDDIEARMVEVLLVDADGKELQSITINQNGADPVFVTDGKGNYIVEAIGGDILVKVTTNLQYNVVIEEGVSWLSLSDTRAVREETLRFTILENEELEERSAVVELKGLDGEVLQSITIKQKGADPLFETDAQSEYLVEAKGGEVLVKVTTNLQYDIVIAEDALWVAVGDTRAVREETLRFTASENEELEERATVVEFKSVDGEVLQSITIKQKGADPLFTTDGEGNYLVEAEGGNISVNITTNLQYNVVIEDDASWVSVLDTRAVREETLTVAVAKNDEFEERSATLKLVDSKNNTLQEITITQESDAANVPDNQIWYLATSQIAPNAEAEFGANVVSHDFADGKGVITFDGAVKSITNQAFAKCADVTMIALPQSVESIEEGCFAECANLEVLISSFATLDNRALVVDGVMVAFAPKGLASYTTPATAKRIGEYTFAYCMELVNVTIDYDVEVIGAWSFTHCEELVNAHIADSVNTIEAGAFSYCYKLGMSGAYTIECGCIMRGGTVVGLVEGIEASGTGGGYLLSIPSYTTSIATGTFMGNGDINEVVIPASVTEIYAWAFTGCHNLVRVICEPLVPPTAVFVDGVWDSFDDQHADRKICVPYDSVKAYREAEGWSEYADDIVGFNFETGEIIPDVENNIIYYTSLDGQIIYLDDINAFDANIVSHKYEDGQGIITFDNEITKIGSHAFSYCENLTSITIPDSVTTIGDEAFYSCESLTSVTIPDSVTTIGGGAFRWCDSLTSVTIPDSLTTVGCYAFSGCGNLNAVYITDLVAWCNIDFINPLTDGSIDLSANPLCYATNLYLNGELVTDLVIPDGVSEIKFIAFALCDSITNVIIPNSVTSIGDGAFFYCSSLTSVTIPDSVTEIGDYAFYGCSSLASVTIPDSVTTIGEGAFWNCHSLTSVYCKATTPPAGGYGMFSFNASGRKIYVPMESVEAYKSADGWSEYESAIVGYDFENGVEVTPKPAYNEIWYTNGSTTEATIPYETTAFGANIVSNTYDGAKECWVIKFDSEVTSIGNDAFYYCDSLTSVTIPDSVTEIGNYAFAWCSSLTSANIPDSVTAIGDEAFAWCESLTSVTIPDSVTTIGEGAFWGCTSLQEFNGKFASEDSRCLIVDGVLNSFAIGCSATEYTIPDSVTSIGSYAFEYCSSLESVTIPDSVTTIGDEAFAHCSSLTSVTIPDSVITIGKLAFYYCRSLTSVTIPDSVTSIGGSAFGYCRSLTSVYCKATTPPAGDDYMFSDNVSDRKIYVPVEAVEAYKSASYWSDYASAIVGYNFTTGEIVTPRQNVASAEELQAALDGAIEGDNIITFVSDITGNVIISQQEGKNIVIDGAGYQFDGTMYIHGNSRYNDIEEVNIRNVNFVTSQSSIAFIESNSTAPTARYSHNINIEECTFEGGSDVVAIRFRHAVNINIRNCAVVGLHSLAQMNGCANVLIDGVWVSDATNGVSLGNTSDCVIMNSVVIASGYGVRADPSATLNIQDSEIHGAQPVVVRKMTEGMSYTLNLQNVMLHTNDLYDIIFTSSNDEGEYVEPLGEWSVTGAEGYKIFPEAEVAGVSAVDLGLSVKWASCNVGANAPEEYGDYFAWGEVSPKDSYKSTNCSTNGKSMTDISGNPQYDAARANWGGSWRLPTKEEQDELRNNCTSEWTMHNGVNGLRVTGPNGNSIFFPAAGFRSGSSLEDVGTGCGYWSSTPYSSGSSSAYCINFGSAGYGWGWGYRYDGLLVRPVMD